MARRKCPSCGAWYDGKKCKECLFELFEDEEKHDHYHGVFGEPSPYTTPTAPKINASAAPAKPVRSAIPVQFPPKAAKKSSSSRKLLPAILIFVIFTVITGLFELISEVSYEIDRWTGEEVISSQEASVALPDEAFCLYAGDGFQIRTLWQPGDPIDGDLSMVVENTANHGITVSSSVVSVNGIMTDAIFFYGEAKAEASGEANLWIDTQALEDAGISSISYITLYLQVYDSNSYEPVDAGAFVTLKTDNMEESVPEAPGGMELYNSNGFLLRYLGWRETETGAFEFLFYGENNRQQAVTLYSSVLLTDGTETDIYLWQDFLPGTRAWFCTLEDDLSKTDFTSPEEIEHLSFTLAGEDLDTYEELFSADLQFACKGNCQ